MSNKQHFWVNYWTGKGRWRQKYFFNKDDAYLFMIWCHRKGYEADHPKQGGTYW